MKFLKDVNGRWINISFIKFIYVSRSNVLVSATKDHHFVEMTKEYPSFEEAQKDLDKIMEIVNKNEN